MNNIENVQNEEVLTEEMKDIHKFNWGAFFLIWVWGIFNGCFAKLFVPWIIIVIFAYLIPCLALFAFVGYIIFAVYSGIHGNEWAWENKKWDSFAQFNEVQKKWAIGSTTAFVIFWCLNFYRINVAIYNLKEMKNNPNVYIAKETARIINKEKNLKYSASGEMLAEKFLEQKNIDIYMDRRKSKYTLYSRNSVANYKINPATNKQEIDYILEFEKESLCKLQTKNCSVTVFRRIGKTTYPAVKIFYDSKGKVKQATEK